MKRKIITVELTEPQFNALASAVDRYEQELIDNWAFLSERRESKTLQRAWQKIYDGWTSQ